MTTYIVLDTERRYDRLAHARYQQSERFDPDTMSGDYKPEHALNTPRWVLHELTAVCWMALSDEGEALSPVYMRSIGLPETDEKAALKALFEFIAMIEGEVKMVTWGGAIAEVPMILAAASTHQLVLPPRLRPLAEAGFRHDHPHIDLMHRFCGQAQRVHLAEFAARLEIPAKITCRPDQVSRLMEQGKWAAVKAVCEGDVLTTAALLARYLHMIGKAPTPLITDLGLCRYVRQNLGHREFAVDYARWEARQQIAAFAKAEVERKVLGTCFC